MLRLLLVLLPLAQVAPPTADQQAAEQRAAEAQKARLDLVVEDIPDEQKLARGAEAISAMKHILDTVLRHLEEAREQKDIVKLNCVNEKLTTIKGLLKISEQAEVALKEATARKDGAAAVHEYSKISIARQKCDQLLAETEACVGELAVYAGDTEVEVEVSDESSYSVQDMIDAIATPPTWERPPAASPYQ